MWRSRLCWGAVAAAVGMASLTMAARDARADENAGNLRIVSVSESGGPLTIYAPYLIAIGAGIFERHGIKIVEHPFGSGPAAFSDFAGGSADFCICGANQVLIAGASGRDVLSVFNSFLGGAAIFVGAKKYEKDRGTDLKKYDGAVWGFTTSGSVTEAYMISAAKSLGLDWSKQRALALGTVDAYIPALQTGRVDIITMDPKSAAQAIKLGIGYPVLSTIDPASAEPIWGKQIGLPVTGTRAFAKKNPKLMQDFVDALREGLVTVQKNLNNPDVLFKMYPATYQAANQDYKIQWGLVKSAYGVDGTFTDQELKDTVNFTILIGQLKVPPGATFDPKRYFDNSWALQAIKNSKSAP
jgi:NitT/TauT family transport system substrate-binding protein